MHEVAKCVDIVDLDFLCSVVCINSADSKYWMKMTQMLRKKINPPKRIRSLVDSDQSAMDKGKIDRNHKLWEYNKVYMMCIHGPKHHYFSSQVIWFIVWLWVSWVLIGPYPGLPSTFNWKSDISELIFWVFVRNTFHEQPWESLLSYNPHRRWMISKIYDFILALGSRVPKLKMYGKWN